MALLLALLLALTPLSTAAQDSASPGSTPDPVTTGQREGGGPQVDLDELRRRVEILAEEVEKLRSADTGRIDISEARRQALGLSPSAAAAYGRTREGVSLAGYGEMLLENYASANEAGAGNAPTTRLDFLRAILYAGYRFNDRFLFNSEIEIEHAGEIFVEFAYLDYLINDSLTVRGGLLLLPLGLVNEFHEPTVFIGSRRPETEQRILPSTWRENGAGILGSFGRMNVRAYVVNGLSASGFTSAGLRGGRQRGIQARAANLAVAARVDVTPVPGIFAGFSIYNGGSGQDAVLVNGERLDIGTTVGELHGQAQLRGFDIRGLYARASIDDAGPLSTALRLASNAPVAEEMDGGYVQFGYNLLARSRSTLSVMPYVRLEHVDTQRRIPVGFTRDLSRDGTLRTLGAELKPISQIVLKAEYQWVRNQAATGRNQFNLNLGYSF